MARKSDTKLIQQEGAGGGSVAQGGVVAVKWVGARAIFDKKGLAMNVSFGRRTSLMLLRHVGRRPAPRAKSDRDVQVLAEKGHLYFINSHMTAGCEALVLEPGAFWIRRVLLEKVLGRSRTRITSFSKRTTVSSGSGGSLALSLSGSRSPSRPRNLSSSRELYVYLTAPYSSGPATCIGTPVSNVTATWPAACCRNSAISSTA